MRMMIMIMNEGKLRVVSRTQLQTNPTNGTDNDDELVAVCALVRVVRGYKTFFKQVRINDMAIKSNVLSACVEQWQQ